MSSQRRLYLDNAATSFPKPPAVLDAMVRYATTLGASPGRGAYAPAIESARLVAQCRQRINTLIHGQSPEHVIFTLNATDALNLAIKGLAHHHVRRAEPVHLITTEMDHNSILRPLNALVEANPNLVTQTRVACDHRSGLVDPADIAAAIEPHTRLIALIHGSNVTGAIQPVAEIGRIGRQRGVTLLVDAAQSMGHLPIDVQAMGIDLLAFPGHKGLLGPLGTGGLYVRPGLEDRIDPLREGGTGTVSERDVQPSAMPDKYESGSCNAIGIIGLSEGVKWILDQGIDTLWAHERTLMRVMLERLRGIPGLTLLGPQALDHRCGVFSITIEGIEPGELAALLDSQYGIFTRAGIHCAPRAHQALGTLATGGATRLSLGPFVTEDDVRYAAQAITEVCHSLMAEPRA